MVEPLTGRNARPIPITAEMRQKAQQMADELVDRYERALKGEFGRYEPALMTRTYCNDEEIVGEITVEAFRDQVERGALLNVWGRKGVLTNLAQLPSQPAGAPKPSRLYCEHHNPRRSVEARRAYQRDRRFLPEFEALIDRIWMEESHLLSYRCAEDYVYVRSKAYQLIQEYKAPTIRIDELLAEGISSQAEIARRLGISRQAVSAAFKRRALRKVKAEKA